MSYRFKQTVIAILAGALLSASPLMVTATTQDTLPDIGTTAGGTLSINQELVMGDFYLRQLRAGAPLINDPLLLQYINQLGGRLVKSADSVRTPFHFFSGQQRRNQRLRLLRRQCRAALRAIPLCGK
ncbi:hypothetical protein OS42_00370 [Dickeya oryzae]